MPFDWKKAPDWARYIANDGDGTWWWFELKPVWDGSEWFGDGQFELAFRHPNPCLMERHK